MSNNFIMENKKILGIIPARGGSKGIPGKNIKEFCGKPLIAWTIEAALESKALSRLVVSTDYEEIAKIAGKYGAEIPFFRPAELAGDKSPTLSVIIHTVKYLMNNEGYKPDFVLLLEPTCPSRKAKHIKEAIDLILRTAADSVVSVVEVPGHYNPFWQFRVDNNQKMEIFTGGSFNKIIIRRQDLPKTYTRNGAIYIFKTELLFSVEPSFYGNDSRAYIMDAANNVDIDTPEDWLEAEKKMRLLLNK